MQFPINRIFVFIKNRFGDQWACSLNDHKFTYIIIRSVKNTNELELTNVAAWLTLVYNALIWFVIVPTNNYENTLLWDVATYVMTRDTAC